MSAHTHDGIDWAERVVELRQADELHADARRSVAHRLVESLPAAAPPTPHPTVLDVGSGAGGMSAALATALAARGGGTLVLVDAVPELLAAAADAALGAEADGVEVRTVRADLSDTIQLAGLPTADLVWASNVTHHLPDQQLAVTALAQLLVPAGQLALAEGGLHMRCLPWDLGIGEPGLADRLTAAQTDWFRRMRTEMPGSVRLPFGWNRALSDAGLTRLATFSYLVDHPAPASEQVRAAVVGWLARIASTTEGLLGEDDTAAVRRLLDVEDPAFVGARDDVFLLAADTVYTGWAGSA